MCARRVEGVTEKLLECAKAEFLEKGYESASLRNIAARAGSSKGAIYIRYADKSSLFAALVDEAAEGLIALSRRLHDDFARLPGTEQAEQVTDYSDRAFEEFVDHIYSHFDEFKLLITRSYDEVYSAFKHRLVALEVDSTLRYVEDTGSDAIRAGRLTPNLAHLLSESFFTGVFEIVVHDMPPEEGRSYIARLRQFYAAGWMTILAPVAGTDP